MLTFQSAQFLGAAAIGEKLAVSFLDSLAPLKGVETCPRTPGWRRRRGG